MLHYASVPGQEKPVLVALDKTSEKRSIQLRLLQNRICESLRRFWGVVTPDRNLETTGGSTPSRISGRSRSCAKKRRRLDHR